MAPPGYIENEDNSKRQKLEEEENKFLEVFHLLKLQKVVPTSPTLINDLSTITKLDFPGCELTELPSSLPEALPNLSILFLSKNKFTELPAIIGHCKKLQMVAFKANGLSSINPDALQSQLRWLILTDNNLTSLPDTIGRCTILQKIMLSGNKLLSLPDTITNCKKLELIRLSSNQLEEPPMKLLNLPNLKWVALSENPFSEHTKSAEDAHDLQLPVLKNIPEGTGEILGEGAGGITRKVMWNNDDNIQQPVAVKAFCGAMTSDGSPWEERHMSLTVSSNIKSDFLIKLIGETASGCLVMEYLDQYKALAGPPSFDTCSRDVYTCDKNFMTEDQAISMLTGLLEVLTKLHKIGVCHGDFYAHNILISGVDQYNVKLSDFGAAFFYDNTSEWGKPLERTELRAFGVLVEEVTELFADKKKSLLQDLAKACQNESACFAEVNAYWKEQCK